MAGYLEIEPTLQSACINAIADQIDIYIDKYTQQSVVASPQSNVFFPRPMSEDILKAVCKKGRLDDKAASFFSEPTRFQMRRAYLRKAGHLTSTGLRNLLSGNVFTDINAAEINEVRANSPLIVNRERKRITVADIVGSINTATKETLKVLNVSGIPSEEEDLMPLAIDASGGQFKKLSVLVNVRSLNVSYTNFADSDLNTVIACMRHLESLDISGTYVRSILHLGDMHAPKLKSLSMSNLDGLNMPKETLFDVFCKMSDLQHLDVSTESTIVDYPPLAAPSDQNSINAAIEMVMMGGGHPLPKLLSLDISGRKGIGELPFRNFYQSRSQLTFLGLLHTSLDALPCCVDEKHPTFNPNVKVTGNHTKAQETESLKRYYRRPFFAKKALISMFYRTWDQLEVDQLELAATSCVYKLLTEGERVLRIPARMLTKVVSEILATMERFPDKGLQRNCLIILNKDWILNEVSFNYFKTVQLVMQSLCSNEDGDIDQLAVAIIWSFCGEISTEETDVLGSTKYIKAFLRIVETKVNANSFDPTLRTTLYLLWYLTSGSPTTCENCIDNGGLGLFMKVLLVQDEIPIFQRNVLGVLNNLAQFSILRHHLLKHDIKLLESVQKLLHSKHIKVSFFAAGVISHLAILNSTDWKTMTTLDGFREDMLSDLYSCVLSWTPHAGEMGVCDMIGFQTLLLQPFFPLLERDDTPAMQLWAAWAVRHALLKNAERDCQEIWISEQNVECLLEVRANPKLDTNVNNLIQLTLEFIQELMPEWEEMLAGI